MTNEQARLVLKIITHNQGLRTSDVDEESYYRAIAAIKEDAVYEEVVQAFESRGRHESD